MVIFVWHLNKWSFTTTKGFMLCLAKKEEQSRLHRRKPWVWVRKLSLQPMVQRCYIRLFTLKICMNHINQSNFIRAKFTRRTRNWRATSIHNTWFHWVGRGHRGHAYLIENKRTSQGGPTGDERGNRRESPVGYQRWVDSWIESNFQDMQERWYKKSWLTHRKTVWNLLLCIYTCTHWYNGIFHRGVLLKFPNHLFNYNIIIKWYVIIFEKPQTNKQTN